MKVSVYVEGPWISLYEEEDIGDMVEVTEEEGRRWLAARDAWENTMSEIIAKMNK